MRTSLLLTTAGAVAIALAQGSSPPSTSLRASGEAITQEPEKPSATRSALPPGNAEHGQYLAEHVAMCVECHSGRDEQGGILETRKYLGAEIPVTPARGDNWAEQAPRIRGLPGYDDEQAIRLLTQGAIGRRGERLRPPMPRFRMTPQDAADVIAFLRSLP